MTVYTLTFTQDDMRNTVLTGPDGQPVYHVETPAFKLGSRMTTVKRIVPGREEEVIAVLKFPWAGTDTVEFQGQESVPVKTWLPGSSSRTVWCEKNNTQYTYKFSANGTPELQGPDARVVSSYIPSTIGLVPSSPTHPARPASLQISIPEADDPDIVDTIVVSFLLVEDHHRKSRRQQQDHASAQTMTNSMGMSATAGNVATIGL